MPNREALQGRVVLVTGASSGIGLETAKALAAMGAHLLFVGRSAERTEAARVAIDAAGSGRVHAIRGDFSSLEEVRRVADDVLAFDMPLHVVVHNAGLWHQERTPSQDGFEDTFAVNHLAPFLLTHLLLPRMLKSDGDRRLVHVSSRLHEQAGNTRTASGRAIHAMNVLGVRLPPPKSHRFDFDDLACANGFRGLEAYARSKLAQLLFSAELARRLPEDVTSNGVHPGSVNTSVTRDNAVLSVAIRLAGPLLKTPAQGARTSVHVASDVSLRGVTGRYFESSREATPSPAVAHEADALRLWDLSLSMVGLSAQDLAPAVRQRRVRAQATEGMARA